MGEQHLRPQWWRDRPVFVTGCNGFLGTWLTHALIALGAQVVGLVRDPNPRLALSKGSALNPLPSNPPTSLFPLQSITAVYGDVRDRALLERTLNEYEIKTVFHLAAQALIGEAHRNPTGTFEINIGGTWSLLEAARRTPCVEQIIISSSDKAYGASPHLPYTEAMPLQGHQPYEVSKSCMDLIARCYANTYGLAIGVTRCSNLYGGGDLNWNRIVPGTVRAVLGGTAPEIRSDGTLRRDYLYIEDAVNAYLTLVQALAADQNLKGQAWNFGSGVPVSVLEMVQKILAVAGCNHLQPRILGQPNHEVPVQYLDSSHAASKLQWQPHHTLEAGLRQTVNWYREYLS
ncbi:MAG: GDP-mannose 4,6-dehydratase [Abitibacteriaceae bacterium]|nr:GDP-mannose 4,6-dehydratase [Abditibacteriaceae bacterium]MBV9866861.1 GDP-mannose 4,6-dehydratase [Abditibacteriaceae bacterium]